MIFSDSHHEQISKGSDELSWYLGRLAGDSSTHTHRHTDIDWIYQHCGFNLPQYIPDLKHTPRDTDWTLFLLWIYSEDIFISDHPHTLFNFHVPLYLVSSSILAADKFSASNLFTSTYNNVELSLNHFNHNCLSILDKSVLFDWD